MIIDAQVHLWEADRPGRRWPGGAEVPAQGAPLGADRMIALMDDCSVDRAIVVPPIWAGDDNQSALDWAAVHGDRLAVMGRFDLWAPDRDRIHRWLEQPGMLGIRMSYGPERGDSWLDPEAFRWFWTGADRLELPVMLLLQGFRPEQVKAVGDLAAAFPRIKWIIDHLGLRKAPPGSGVQAAFEGHEHLLGLARYPNVCVKWSSLPFYSRAGFPYADLNPYLQRSLDKFGAQRIMWGSDLTRLRHIPYEQLVRHATEGLEFLSAEEREWILGRTAATVLGWPGRSVPEPAKLGS